MIGLGGILNGEDAAEFLIAGASAVQVGTATFIDPRAPLLIARELGKLAERLKLSNIQQLVGTVDSSVLARSTTKEMQPCKIEQ